MTNDEETTVSWKAIQPHWKVWSADDVEIGEVFQAVGDENTDIFDGLAIAHHGGPALMHHWLDKPLYVSQEQVAAIQDGHVRLTVSAAQAQDLPEHTVAEAVEILPEEASLWERFKSDLEKH